MEVRTYHFFPEDAKREVDFVERLSEILKALDTFLDYLQKEVPEINEKYRAALKDRLRPLLEKSQSSVQTFGNST